MAKKQLSENTMLFTAFLVFAALAVFYLNEKTNVLPYNYDSYSEGMDPRKKQDRR
jgi:hypothetical protein